MSFEKLPILSKSCFYTMFSKILPFRLRIWIVQPILSFSFSFSGQIKAFSDKAERGQLRIEDRVVVHPSDPSPSTRQYRPGTLIYITTSNLPSLILLARKLSCFPFLSCSQNSKYIKDWDLLRCEYRPNLQIWGERALVITKEQICQKEWFVISARKTYLISTTMHDLFTAL